MALRCEDEEEELEGWRCGVSGMCTIPNCMYHLQLSFVATNYPGMDVHVYAACTSGRARTTISTRVSNSYRTASELSHVDVYSEAKRAAVSRVHAVSWYTACKNE